MAIRKSGPDDPPLNNNDDDPENPLGSGEENAGDEENGKAESSGEEEEEEEEDWDVADAFEEDEDEDEDEEEGDWEFDEEEIGEFDEEEYKRERQKKEDRLHNHPVYKQALEILHLTEALVASLQPRKGMEGMEENQASQLMEAAMIIPAKIAGAMGSGDYVYAMQNAALIRYYAESLRLSTNTLHHFTRVDRKHCRLHRAEMEKFRELFREWMSEVKKYDKPFEDEWNVF